MTKMYKKIFKVFFAAVLLSGSCSSIPSVPTLQPTVQTTNTPQMLTTATSAPASQLPTQLSTPQMPSIPTLSELAIESKTPLATRTIVVEPTYTHIFETPIGSKVPIFPGAHDVYYDYFPSTTGEAGNSVYYQTDAEQTDIQIFYMEELVHAGWAWVYTEVGESLVITAPAPALIMEFRKGEENIGIAASGFGAGITIVFAAVDYSGFSQMTGFIGGIAGGLDLMGPDEDEAQADVMQFSSTLLEFRHPSNWLATDSLMQIFETDDNINFISGTRNCGVHMENCFVNFADLTGSHFDIPASIRTHPKMYGLSLEEANVLRWEQLNSSINSKRYAFPEDLTLPGSPETIEVRNIELGDGTPAIQRIYRWKQENVENSITSTYTLFMSGDLLMEFHTDFTSDEWKNEQSIINQVIAGMKIVP